MCCCTALCCAFVVLVCRQYLEQLLTYLLSFYERTQPLSQVHKQLQKLTDEVEAAWKEGQVGVFEVLVVLGYGLWCGWVRVWVCLKVWRGSTDQVFAWTGCAARCLARC